MRLAVVVILGVALAAVTNSVYPDLLARDRSALDAVWLYAPVAFAVAAWLAVGALATSRLLAIGYAWIVVALSEILVVRQAAEIGLPPRNDFWTNDPQYWLFAVLTLGASAAIALAGQFARRLLPRHAV